ncbi:unnamed protein product [Closterium sp. NIES-65]|nr:unnamed protein product [Closterium sp. NIES-65]
MSQLRSLLTPLTHLRGPAAVDSGAETTRAGTGGGESGGGECGGARSPHLATPPGFPPLPSSPPLQPAAVDTGAETEGTEPGGAGTEGTELEGAVTEGTEREGAETEDIEPESAGTEGTEPASAKTETSDSGGAASSGADSGGAASPSGVGVVGAPTGGPGAAGAGGAGVARGAGAAGAASAGGARGTGAAGAGGPGGAAGAGGHGAGGAGGAGGATGARGARGTRAAGASGAGGARGAGAAGAGGAGGAGGPGGATGALRHLLSLQPSATGFPVAGTTLPLLCPPEDQSQAPLLPHSPLPAPTPSTTVPTATRLLATVVTDPTFSSPAASALVAELVDIAAVYRLYYLAGLVSDPVSACPPSVGGETALGCTALGCDVLEDRQEELECLAAASPYHATMLLAPEGDLDALDIPTPRSYREAISGEYSSQWQTAMDAEIAFWKSTGTYVDEVPPPGANIVSGMWIFRVKRPPGSSPTFKARYVARGFSQREGVDFFQNFSPTPKMTTLRVLLHVAAQREYELHSLDFSTAFLQGSLHEAIWLRRPQGFTGSFPEGTQWSLRRPVYGLRQAPREWHDTLRTTLAALEFAPSTADPSLFLRTDTSLPPFYILMYVDDLVLATADTEALALVKAELRKRHTCTDLGELRSYLRLQITRDRARRTITLTRSHMVHQVLHRFRFTYSSPQPTPLATGHSLSAPPSDESVEPSGPYPELVGCLMYLMTCTRPDLVYPLSLLARYVAPGRHQKVHFDVAKRVLRYLCSTSGMGLVLGGRGSVVLTGHSDASWADDQATQRSFSSEAEIYAGAMAAQELRWLTYLLTDLGERPCSPLVLYVDNKAMLALCRQQRLKHRTKHIALRYFLVRELQQRGQLRLVFVASRANTADVFTKALGAGDHQRFCTALGLVPTLPHLLVA